MGLENLGFVIGTASCAAVAGALVAASLVDLRSRIIPNACPLLIAASWALASPCGVAPPLAEGLLGACGLAGFLIACDAVARRLWGPGGVGGGDVKLVAALGLWTGLVPGLAMTALACAFALAGRLVGVAVRCLVAAAGGPDGTGGPAGTNGAAKVGEPAGGDRPAGADGPRAEALGLEGGLGSGGGMPMAPSISLGFLAALLLRSSGWG